ncbi:hypothetical protein [Calidithermus chliarophilus]|uniref:hypothetical protein n=1 Tax=Calidithermus chliarophilus TaxID=52023 RepID=UPI00041331AB|nr:hypothetical protein [Calidithermus chliarophilus]
MSVAVKTCIFLALALVLGLRAVLGQAVPAGKPGVPRVAVNYRSTVDAWWANHPLNPAAPGGIPVGGVRPFPRVVEIGPEQSIQEVIDRYRDSGVTIKLRPGVYRQSFVTRGFSNIQLVADEPGTVRIQGRALLSGGYGAIPKGAKNPAIKTYIDFVNCIVKDYDPNHDLCRRTAQNRPGNIYLKNLTFDGYGEIPTPLLTVAGIRDVVLDNLTFTGSTLNLDPGIHHPGLVSGHAMIDNVWIRGGSFEGQSPYAVYLDGLHGGGVIGATFASSFGSGGLLFLTNDDFSQDLDRPANGIQKHEQRNGQFIVVEGNTFGGTHTAVGFTAEQVLVQNNEVTRRVEWFTQNDGRCSNRWGTFIYPNVGHIIRNNRVNYATGFHLIDANTAAGNCENRAFGQVGRYTLEGNKIRTLGPEGLVGLVGPKEYVQGPNVVRENCVGKECY